MDQTNSLIKNEGSINLNDLPSEILEEIFIRIRMDSINVLSLSEVCLQWSRIICSSQFWKRKLNCVGLSLPKFVLLNTELSWRFFHSILLSRYGIPYQRNLILNGSGELENNQSRLNGGNRNEDDFDEAWFNSWSTLSSGGQGWRLFKDIPSQMMPKEVEHRSYFATSNFSCTKEQFLSLIEKGVNSEILDTFQPDIEIEEFYSKSANHGAIYDVHVCLLDGCGNVLGEGFKFRKQMEAEEDETWRKVSHTFKEYGVGARYVKYYHGGMAEDMEEGWFGARMTGAAVKVKFPEVKKSEQLFKCECKTKHRMVLKLS